MDFEQIRNNLLRALGQAIDNTIVILFVFGQNINNILHF